MPRMLAQSIFDSVASLIGEITTQYVMRYTPSSTDEPTIFRTIRVEVALPGVKIRHRMGYYPNDP